MSKKPRKLTPPDLKQCQAEKPNGYTAWSLGGVPGLVRCTEKPSVVATAVEPYEDGQHGSMSLCADCLEVFQEKMGPGYATFKIINAEEG
jgi:hypothetical protein